MGYSAPSVSATHLWLAIQTILDCSAQSSRCMPCDNCAHCCASIASGLRRPSMLRQPAQPGRTAMVARAQLLLATARGAANNQKRNPTAHTVTSHPELR